MPEKSCGIKEYWEVTAGFLMASVAEGVVASDRASIGSVEVC